MLLAPPPDAQSSTSATASSDRALASRSPFSSSSSSPAAAVCARMSPCVSTRSIAAADADGCPESTLRASVSTSAKKSSFIAFFLLRSVREFSICGSAQKFRSVRKLWMREERAGAWAECGVCFFREERYNRAQSCICCLRRRRTLYGYSNYNMEKNKNRQKDTQTIKCFAAADAVFYGHLFVECLLFW